MRDGLKPSVAIEKAMASYVKTYEIAIFKVKKSNVFSYGST